jgi:tRNA U54 and U55 pseudouridine synthase Pus10
MKMDLAEIQPDMQRQAVAAQKAVTGRMLQEMAQLQRQFEHTLVVSGSEDRKVRVLSSDRSFQINFHPRPIASPDADMTDLVRPRMEQLPTVGRSLNDVTVIGDSAFIFEMTADDDAVRVFRRLSRGEFKFEVLDSSAQRSKVKIMFKSLPARKEFEARVKELQLRNEELIDLDSLLKESRNSGEEPKKVLPDSEALILDL